MNKAKELPHDLLAERSLIGCLLLDGDSFNEVTDLALRPDDFYHPQYAVIFEAIKDLSLDGKPIDLVTVCSKLKERGKLEAMGGEAFVIEILEDQASGAHVYHYATVVKESSTKRKVIKMAQRVIENGMSFEGDTSDFLNDVESNFFKLTSEAKGGGMVRLNHNLKINLKQLEEEGRAPGEISGVSTGFKKLDELLLGMQAGQLIILAARPAMGKSALALNLAVNCCKNTKLPIAFFSLEMLGPELSMRILCSEAKVDSKRIKSKNFLDQDLRNLASAVQTLSDLPIYINDRGDTSIFDVQSHCRKIKAEQGLGMVVIDYIQLMKPHNGSIPREQQISEISRGLKNLAKEMECPVIGLSQLNRSVEARTEKRPLVSDLRESGSIEQDADIVMLLYRDEVYDPNTKDKGIGEVIVGKNRAGEIGTAKLSWVGPYYSFGNLTQEAPPPTAQM